MAEEVGLGTGMAEKAEQAKLSNKQQKEKAACESGVTLMVQTGNPAAGD